MKRVTIAAALLLPLMGLSGCKEEENGTAAAQPAPPPPEVGVVTLQAEDLPVASDLPGRIAATRIAEVRARVDGIVESRVFTQGGRVEAGDELFHIDPAPYQIAVEAAQAGVARAEAALDEASHAATRIETLTASNASSRAQLDSARAAQLTAEAELAVARSELHAAELDLSYTRVTAPISGVIGRAFVTEGALVQASGTEVLTTVQSLDPVYADIVQPVSELMRLRRAMADGTLSQMAPGVARVRLFLDDGTEYATAGQLLFSEATVEETSGQVTLRAEFPNPDGVLLPGMFVRVAVDMALDGDAVAVPSQAVTRDAAGAALVWVVDGTQKAEQRKVTIDRPEGNRLVIDSGLAPGETVIVDGLQKVAPGAPVAPVPWSDPTAAASRARG
ncbi:efflux RND transporter periplasmic adaptor subunit [Salipiger sp. PrR002]|uniref:efflux RND transporter periplasmic adaptor subunit n=1 Tax=Salipiger sp. PrR002 TaxID=2706489 RepID=UPI0013B7F034|nr:efflux RND transporter periplasmic adaptor subunit [Salipiger sp. PrR002]NDV98793.1 efflux RND transporter periplasmic adaptor subunit [Salipiger sp. PrR002]NDW55530.1 efflux RND transporter periplasmic adaptor subunit [Salipiger sp. PrR004]